MLATIRKTLELIGPRRRRRFILVGILATMVSALEALSALLVLVILRLVLEPGEIPELPVVGDIERFAPGLSYEQFVIAAAVAFGVFFAARSGLFLFQHYAEAKVVENTGVLLADRLVDGYLSMPYEFHLRRNSAELIRNAYDNVQQIVNGIFRPLSTLIAEVSMVVAMLAVLLLVSPLMTLGAAVLMGGIVGLTLAFIQPRLKRRGRQRQRAARAALQQLQQGLGGLRDIKILGREATFSRNFLDVRKEMAEAQVHRATLSHLPRLTLETGFLAFILVVLVVAVIGNGPTQALTTLGVFAYAGMRLQPSLQKIAQGLNNLRFTEAAVDDLAGDLDRLDASIRARKTDDADLEPLPLEHALELRGVRFRYEGADRDALVGIDLEIRRGESIGIAGPTGGGKSTLLDVICGLLPPVEGKVLVDGKDMTQHVRAWQRSLGVVHQSSFLIDDTLRRNIALGVPDDEIDEERVLECIRMASLESVVAELPQGLDAVVGERGIRFSGGQRQRVTLARGLYRRPSVLILDEGTAALDNETEREIVDRISGLAREMTLIMVAHRLSTIEGCDRIFIVEDATISATGSFNELAQTNASFRRLSASHFSGSSFGATQSSL